MNFFLRPGGRSGSKPQDSGGASNAHDDQDPLVGTQWRVARSGVVLRENIEKESKMISIIPPGTVVRVVEVGDILQKMMKLDAPYSGWVNRFDHSGKNSLLHQVDPGISPLIFNAQSNAGSAAVSNPAPPPPPPPPAISQNSSMWTVIGELGAVVRETVDLNSRQITTLPAGTSVLCLEIAGRRMKLRSNLIVGWASIQSAEGYQILQKAPENIAAATVQNTKQSEKFNSEGFKTALVPNTFHHDERGNKVNRAFHHYCGQEVSRSGYIFPCSICSGQCGPSNGCQCLPCYLMDASLDEISEYSEKNDIPELPPVLAPILKREFSEQSETIIKNEGTTAERQQSLRNALSSIKMAFNAGRITLAEKNTLKDQMCGSLLYNELILLKLTREEERNLRVELALRLKYIVDDKKNQSPSIECMLCLEPFLDSGLHVPHLLPCGHTFCLGCIRSLPASGRVCPVDRRALPRNEKDMPVNFALTEILRIRS